MEYNEIPNSDFAVLCLTAERGEVSGYEISRLFGERGFHEWARLGNTSIYKSLKRLQDRALLKSVIDTKKVGKGPPPRRFSLTESGFTRLRSEIIASLRNGTDHDGRFDIALGSLPMVEVGEAAASLRVRAEELTNQLAVVERKCSDQGGSSLPLHVRALFRHGVVRLEAEVGFLTALILALESNGGERDGTAGL